MFFISVNKFMLASLKHNYEVYFLHILFSVFIISYLDIGPNCILFIFSLALAIAIVPYMHLQTLYLHSNLFVKDIF